VDGPAASNVLAQKLLQLTMPGVPDVYQGQELADLSLVDPDNRRPVDYAARRAALAALDGSPDVETKLLVTARALRLRRDRPAPFAGAYRALRAEGSMADHLVAFGRGDLDVVTVATRLPVRLEQSGGWSDTRLALPEGEWTDVLTARRAAGQSVASLLERLPVALLVRDPDEVRR
jgi:(1->4)-alpha-D-glucan 1-alpha-D-glucosylmutase